LTIFFNFFIIITSLERRRKGARGETEIGERDREMSLNPEIIEY